MSAPNRPPPPPPVVPPPQAERDSNTDGRVSRASGVSDVSSGQPRASRAASRGPPPSRSSQRPRRESSQQPPLPQAIASMLRTSTEMGSVGGIPNDLPGVPSFAPRSRRSGTTSRNSARSSRSARSAGRGSQSQYQDYGRSASHQSRGDDINNVPWVPDSLSPTVYSMTGSSPLVPRAQQQLGSRSRSLTAAQMAGRGSQASEYSVGSPPQYDFLRYPPPPPGFRIPNRAQRPSSRPVSPARSDNNIYPQPPRPAYGNGQQFRQSSLPVAVRHGHPSDPNLNHPDGPHGWNRPPSRSRTPASVRELGPENQPSFTQYRHPGPTRGGMSQRSQHSNGSAGDQSTKGSLSSQSTNPRLDSDVPSSDATAPPTPQDNQLGNHTVRSVGSNQTFHETTVARKEETLYYDGSEAFEVQESSLVHHETHSIKTIQEEQPGHEPISKKDDGDADEENANAVTAIKVEIAESSVSSPVARRLTRELVKSVLEPVSTVENQGSPGELAETVNQDVGKDSENQETVDSGQKPSPMSLHPVEKIAHGSSIGPKAESTIMNSSTLKTAVDSAVPIVTEKGTTLETEQDEEQARGSGTQSSTEDGMSDLLDRYQHTDTKTEGHALNDVPAGADESVENKSNHITSPSDKQSFKSCTDRPNTNDGSVQNPIPTSSESRDGLPAPGKLRCDTDAGSFKTCKDNVTPELGKNTPSNAADSGERLRSPPPAGVPGAVDENWPLPANRDIDVLQSGTGQQSSMNPATQSSSAPMLDNVKRIPPVIPPRQSSNKPITKLLRPLFSKRSKTGSDISGKGGEDAIPEDGPAQEDGLMIPTPPPMRDRRVSVNVPSVVDKNQGVQKDSMNTSHQEHSSALVAGAAGTGPSSVSKSQVSRAVSFDKAVKAPLPNTPPSIENPHNGDSSNFRALSSPLMSVEPHEPSKRDSQSTTHLSWPNPKSVPRPVNIYEQSRATMHEKEETTTDLARSGYTYHSKYQSGYLPDVKEESHEDSSLNTVISNLKHSSVRPDRGGSQQEGRTVDNVFMPLRDTLALSQSTSALQETRGLPSLDFTEDNLVDEVLQNFRSSQSVEETEEKPQGPGDGDGDGDGDTQPKESAGAIYKDKFRSLFSPFYKKASPEKAAAKQAAVDQAAGKKVVAKDKQRKLPPDLMEELDKLTVPSTQDLNERISEYLDSKRAGDNDTEWGGSSGGGFVEKAIEEIHEVGSGPTNKLSNARLRPIPGSPKLVLVPDEVYQNMTGRMKVEGGGQEVGVVGGAVKEKKGPHSQRARDTASLTTTPVTPVTPAPAATPALSTTSPSLPAANLDSETHRDSTSSLRSASSAPTGSSTDTRPWNSNRNYPWAKDLSVDIALTSPTTPRYPPRLGPSHLRYASGASSETVTPSPTPFGSSPPPSRGSLSAVSSQGKSLANSRPSSKRKNVGICSVPLEPISENSWPPGTQEATAAHVAGERYPPSSHPLPRDLHLPAEDVDHTAYASDEESVVPPPNRQSRSERKKVRRDAGTRLEEQRQSYTEESVELPSRRNRNTFTGVEGMPKVTYISRKTIKTAKDFGCRIVNKLRNLFRRKVRSFEPRVSNDRAASLRAPRD